MASRSTSSQRFGGTPEDLGIRPDPVMCLRSRPRRSAPTAANLDDVPLAGEYAPSPQEWVRDQVEAYERSGGAEANTLLDTAMPIVIVTTRGVRSGKLRKFGLMRVEHDGDYALVASKGGAPEHPEWYWNLKADPTALMIQDGPEPFDAVARELSGNEREVWWERAVAAYPPYAEYQTKTDRQIPVFLATPGELTGVPGAVAPPA